MVTRGWPPMPDRERAHGYHGKRADQAGSREDVEAPGMPDPHGDQRAAEQGADDGADTADAGRHAERGRAHARRMIGCGEGIDQDLRREDEAAGQEHHRIEKGDGQPHGKHGEQHDAAQEP